MPKTISMVGNPSGDKRNATLALLYRIHAICRRGILTVEMGGLTGGRGNFAFPTFSGGQLIQNVILQLLHLDLEAVLLLYKLFTQVRQVRSLFSNNEIEQLRAGVVRSGTTTIARDDPSEILR